MKNYVIVGGIIREDNKILLVHHKPEHGKGSYWALPGGTAEMGENAINAISREVVEETGLKVKSWNSVAYSAQYLDWVNDWQSVIIVFEGNRFEGEICCNDPDDDIIEAKFFDLEAALKLIEDIPFLMMKEPLIEYLLNKPTNNFWVYEKKEENQIIQTQKLI